MNLEAKGKLRPWSISTTVRNPDRLRSFLRVLREMDGEIWNQKAQSQFQAELIRARVYGYGERQFYNGLSGPSVELLESDKPISSEQAAMIFEEKNYSDAPMRGRTSYKPLERFGFAIRKEGRVRITKLGHRFLNEDSDITDIFTRSLLKWQLPNPLDARSFRARDGYNIKPFVAALHVIAKVNERSNAQPGITLNEFQIFLLTLIDCRDIEACVADLLDYRQRSKSIKIEHIRPQFETKHLGDYADNALRYFMLSGLLERRSEGRRIDIAPLRREDVKALLASDDACPQDFSEASYLTYLSDAAQPVLAWEDAAARTRSLALLRETAEREGIARADLDRWAEENADIDKLRSIIAQNLVAKRKDKERLRLQKREAILDLAQQLQELPKASDRESRSQAPLRLEMLATQALIALNDALEIRSNAVKSATEEMLATAPGGRADIECEYEGFVATCEVTLSRGRQQWVQEGQPVMRHLRAFEDRHADKTAFCLFLAPTIHDDTCNTFWNSVRHAYQGKRQKILPLTLEQFGAILELCAECRHCDRPLAWQELLDLYQSLSAFSSEDSQDWRRSIGSKIASWTQSVRGERQ